MLEDKAKKIIIIAVILFLVIGGLALVIFFGLKPSPTKEANLVFWGVFDDSDVFKPLIDEYNKIYPKIKINYSKKTYETYERDLLETMAAGQGPDIFMLHHTWPGRYQNKMSPAPSEIFSLKNIRDEFVDAAANDFVIGDSIFAAPLYMDTLALYYNKDIFNSAGIAQPPQNWEEFLADVEKIAIRDERGNIIRAGAAIGAARNVNRSTDILCLLMFQSGTTITDRGAGTAVFNKSLSLPSGETFNPGERALEFYTDFVNPIKAAYTWNDQMDYSIDAFYQGKAAMMFNYSYHIPTVKAKSPYLNFAVAAMPQNSTNRVNYANYWGLAVSGNSKDSEAAWQFIKWLTQREQAQKYLEATQRPTSRRDLITWQKGNPDLGVFAEQSLTAYSWYQADNNLIEKYLADMIESKVLGKATLKEAVSKAANDINLLVKKQ